MAVPISFNAFSPRLWDKIDTLQDVSEYFQLLQMIVGMVDNLNLNTRTWGKGG